MNYRTLGRSGICVSPICLGTMNFGGPTDEVTSRRIIDKGLDQGINFIDTADVYTGGESERITGSAIASRRNDWIVATKLANQIGDGPNRKGLGRKWMMEACDESLRRLATDYIDILYFHKEDHSTPMAESVAAAGELIRAGKVRYFGVSNHRSWRVAEISRICDELGVPRPVVSQPYYNAMNRMPEVEHLPACEYFGLGVVPYSPLARGVLSGKYKAMDIDAPAKGTRAGRLDMRMMQTEWRAESLEIAESLKVYCEAKSVSLVSWAVQWVLNNKMVTSVIGGPRTEEQWDDYLAAVDYEFTSEDEALLEKMVASGHPSTPGYNDPAYPIEGRKTWTNQVD